MKKILGCCFMLVASMTSFAEAVDGEWGCLSFDHLNRSYSGASSSLRGSMAVARQSCLEKASSPSRCRVSRNWCQRDAVPMVNARCEAEDESGKRFEAKGNNACEMALNQCESWQKQLNPSKRQHCAIVHR